MFYLNGCISICMYNDTYYVKFRLVIVCVILLYSERDVVVVILQTMPHFDKSKDKCTSSKTFRHPRFPLADHTSLFRFVFIHIEFHINENGMSMKACAFEHLNVCIIDKVPKHKKYLPASL